jgi:hypothetical protein
MRPTGRAPCKSRPDGQTSSRPLTFPAYRSTTATLADDPGAILEPMAAVDLDHPPEGVVILLEPRGTPGQLDPQAWVNSVRRSTPRHLKQGVAEHLAVARELGEV